MAESKSNRLTKYFPLLLDALRSSDPTPMRPAEAVAWIRARIEVPRDELTGLVAQGKQSIFENKVRWARLYLAKAGLVDASKRGLWGLTPEGRSTRLTPEETWNLYVRIRDANITGRVDYGPGTMPVERSLHRARFGNIEFCPSREVALEPSYFTDTVHSASERAGSAGDQ